jgi:hypothetical protein
MSMRHSTNAADNFPHMSVVVCCCQHLFAVLHGGLNDELNSQFLVGVQTKSQDSHDNLQVCTIVLYYLVYSIVFDLHHRFYLCTYIFEVHSVSVVNSTMYNNISLVFLLYMPLMQTY